MNYLVPMVVEQTNREERAMTSILACSRQDNFLGSAIDDMSPIPLSPKCFSWKQGP